MSAYPLVEVFWVDSGLQGEDGWRQKEVLLSDRRLGLALVRSVGLLWHETEDTLYLAHTHDEQDDTLLGVMLIWKPSITSMHTLRKSRELVSNGKLYPLRSVTDTQGSEASDETGIGHVHSLSERDPVVAGRDPDAR